MLAMRHGAARVLATTGEELSLARRIIQNNRGATSRTEIQLSGGRRIAAGEPFIVWNRMNAVVMPAFLGATEENKQYAAMEFFAFLVAWLAAMEGCVSPPVSPRGICDPQISWPGWQMLARDAGLEIFHLRFTSSTRRYSRPGLVSAAALRGGEINNPWKGLANRPDALLEQPGGARARILVAGIGVSAPVYYNSDGGRNIINKQAKSKFTIPGRVIAACRDLAALAKLPVLEIVLAADSSGNWRFLEAQPVPALRDARDVALVANHLEHLAATGAGDGIINNTESGFYHMTREALHP